MNHSSLPNHPDEVELSVVIPCLNEEETLGICLDKALQAFSDHGIFGEVIVADNGSTDASIAIAQKKGVRIVPVAERGYGSALQAGIEAARGPFVLMGDADASYDFGELPKFLDELRNGADLVQGCRLPSGGGTIAPGAMPTLHRWLGNPAFTVLAKIFFRTTVDDVYCGLRAFRKDTYRQWNLQCTGMEFATEMILKASLEKSRIRQVPITLHKDGRSQHGSHLRTFRDGWRTLRLFLVFSPHWLFLYPGTLLMALGLVGFFCAWAGLRIGQAMLDVHTMLVCGLLVLVGFQACIFFVCARLFGISHHFIKNDPRALFWKTWWSLERAIVISTAAILLGIALISLLLFAWASKGFGNLNYPFSMRIIIPGTMLIALGFQGIFGSFMAALLSFTQRKAE